MYAEVDPQIVDVVFFVDIVENVDIVNVIDFVDIDADVAKVVNRC